MLFYLSQGLRIHLGQGVDYLHGMVNVSLVVIVHQLPAVLAFYTENIFCEDGILLGLMEHLHVLLDYHIRLYPLLEVLLFVVYMRGS